VDLKECDCGLDSPILDRDQWRAFANEVGLMTVCFSLKEEGERLPALKLLFCVNLVVFFRIVSF
jgi:hypothetical protein